MILAVTACNKASGISVNLHNSFFLVVVVYSLLIGLWGMGLFIRGSNPSGSFLGALVLAEGVGIVQGLFGLFVVVAGYRPHDALHWLYGIVVVATLPVAYAFSDGGRERRDSLYFALGAFFIVVIALVRAAPTGCPS